MTAAPSPASYARAEVLASLWYDDGPVQIALAPLSWLFGAGVALRRGLYRVGALRARRVGVPVMVVGNITAGGAGKTPFSIWAARRLAEAGWHPGIACRGYGGSATHWPQQVRPDSDPIAVGDEAVLMARRARVPVAAAPDRFRAAAALVAAHGCDLIVCDDGLQHLALARDVEVVMVDGARRFGNGRLLPAGPLRESRSRLRRCDFVVVKAPALPGETEMRVEPGDAESVTARDVRRPLEAFVGATVHAVAGIGNPEGFFSMLRERGLAVVAHPFPDHHRLRPADLDFADGAPVLMTEKDAVKCERFATSRHWAVPVEAALPEEFAGRLLARVDMCRARVAGGA